MKILNLHQRNNMLATSKQVTYISENMSIGRHDVAKLTIEQANDVIQGFRELWLKYRNAHDPSKRHYAIREYAHRMFPVCTCSTKISPESSK